MADENRTETFMKADFLPAYDRTAVPTIDERVATALEYIAYHIGQIDKSLGRISSSLAEIAHKQ